MGCYLKPCPVCGSDDITDRSLRDHQDLSVECEKCGAFAESKSDWNMRVPDPVPLGEIKAVGVQYPAPWKKPK